MKRPSVVIPHPNPSEVLRSHGIRDTGAIGAISDVKQLKTKKLKTLIKDLVADKVSLPNSIIKLRLVAMYLVQKDRKFALENLGEDGLIPFTVHDYEEALQYADDNYTFWRSLSDSEQSDDADEVSSKINSKSQYGKVLSLVRDNMTLKNKEIAKMVVEQFGMKEATANSYVSKAKKELKEE